MILAIRRLFCGRGGASRGRRALRWTVLTLLLLTAVFLLLEKNLEESP